MPKMKRKKMVNRRTWTECGMPLNADVCDFSDPCFLCQLVQEAGEDKKDDDDDKKEEKKEEESEETKKRKREDDIASRSEFHMCGFFIQTFFIDLMSQQSASQERRKKEGRPTKADPRSRNLFGKLLGHLHSAKDRWVAEFEAFMSSRSVVNMFPKFALPDHVSSP